jgi:lysophospholipid acyltransferase (LPLAT)-like uncharacterized protein
MDLNYSFGQKVILFLASILGPFLILLYGLTWRVRWNGLENIEDARRLSEKVIFAFWHSRLLGLCYTHRFRNIGIMVSKSFDGEWIARIVTHLGYRVFRGSASKDGVPALLQMLKSKEGDLSLTVDGPRGPAEKVKQGAISLASNGRMPIVPITCLASRAWRLKSWDRFMIPKPFSVVTVVYGRHVAVPEDGSKDITEKLSLDVETELKRIG